MAAEQPNNIKKPLCAGLLAHVDAGKTTLSEAMLYEAGARRTLGRVDHQDAFLDTHALERARGITIFSKQALLETEHRAVTLVDTPGHVDFSAEAERIMPVLDCAVLVISGTDGVQAHTLTLWRLLERYQVPTFLFLNKMDLPGMGKEKLLAELRQQLSPACVDFTASPEEIAEKMEMPVERVREIMKISQDPVSLETPIGEEEDSHLGDFIQDDHVQVPVDAATYTLLHEQLMEVLDTLTEREQKVLRLRFGLDDGRPRTLEEVGRQFNVTRERIRQIEAKALRKLRHPSRSKKLKDYLDE